MLPVKRAQVLSLHQLSLLSLRMLHWEPLTQSEYQLSIYWDGVEVHYPSVSGEMMIKN